MKVWKVAYGFKFDRSDETTVFINRKLEGKELKNFVTQRISIGNQYVSAYHNLKDLIKEGPPLYHDCRPVEVLNVEDYEQGVDPDQISMIF